MPQADFVADHAEVGFQTTVQVVEQRLQRAQVEDRCAFPVFREKSGDGWQHGSLGFTTGGWCDDQCVLASENRRSCQFLQRPQSRPPKCVDEMVPEKRVKGI